MGRAEAIEDTSCTPVAASEDNVDYHIDANAMHRRIARYYLGKLVGN